MNWKLKALVHTVMPHIPGGDHCHFWVQKHLTKKIPRSEKRLLDAVSAAENHVESFLRHSKTPIEQAVFYEFGAGWDLAPQLALFALGVNRQIIVDLNPLLRLDLANNSAMRLRKLKDRAFKRVPEKTIGEDMLHDLRTYYGIEYYAPYDAKRTLFADNSVDCVTSTETIAHIPEDELKSILAECARILKPGGIMSMTANYDDLYSYFDHGISAYNFLKYSDILWHFFNPSRHFQNRLRHSDYIRLFGRLGLEIVEAEKKSATPEDLNCLLDLRLDEKFQNYALKDLAIHGAHFVVRCEWPSPSKNHPYSETALWQNRRPRRDHERTPTINPHPKSP